MADTNSDEGSSTNENNVDGAINIDWSTISTITSEAVSLLAPIAEVADPSAAAAIALAVKIIQGVMAAEPSAVALYNSITSGTQPTPAQLQAFASSYESAYQQLNSDINAKLATAS